jgi:5'-deoxynucleotidase YfbR-like HD superfamily hydrolase
MWSETKIRGSVIYAGRIERYHTYPTIQTQDVAAHTYRVLVIYRLLFGPVDSVVTDLILFHDSPEILTGDIPFPAKRDNLNLTLTLSDLEKRWYNTNIPWLNFDEKTQSTLNRTRARIKFCDIMEMLEHASHELRLGNKYAEHIILNAAEGCMKLVPYMDVDKKLLEDNVLKHLDLETDLFNQIWYSGQELEE